ncbi:MAG: SIS domain-containing protein [Gemmatimonadota bacterium]
MNAIDRAQIEAKSVASFAAGYFRHIGQVLGRVDLAAVEELAEELTTARNAGATVFVAGNGGSATTAATMANDLGFDVVKKNGIEEPFRILAITENTAVISAVANDVGYENVFLNQLRIHFRPGDRLLVISASGNSQNLIRAAQWVRKRNGRVLGLLGFDGGALLEMCDVVVHVPTEIGEYGPVEDAHLVVNHVLAHWFQGALRES